MNMNISKTVGIIGSGNIGHSYAMLFSRVGYKVKIYDISQGQLDKARTDISTKFESLLKSNMWESSLSIAEAINNISYSTDIEETVVKTFFVIECVPERLEMKRSIYEKIDSIMESDSILASSTSSIAPSKLSHGLLHRSRFIVCHPTNPPFFCPAVEVVPGNETLPEVTERTMKLMKELKLKPVHVKKEALGFVLNRMQYALLNECWRIYEDGITDLEGIDTIMRDGLGRRYAFMGPMETIYLNGDGIENYCERFGDMIYEVSSDFGPTPKLGPKELTTQQIEAEISQRIPFESIESRKEWRDKRLIALQKLRTEFEV